MIKIIISTIFMFSFFAFALNVNAQQSESNELRTRVGEPPTSGGTGDIPPFPSNIKSSLVSEFNITLNDFGRQHQEWLWELIWSNSDTNFPSLLSGIIVNATGTSGISSLRSCSNLRLAQYSGESFFKFISTHEFSHYIHACKPRSVTKLTAQRNAFSTEGGISDYARRTNTSCLPGWENGPNEDYADMIAYYLNRNAGHTSGPSACHPSSPPNPFFGSQGNQYPIHYEVAESILLQ